MTFFQHPPHQIFPLASPLPRPITRCPAWFFFSSQKFHRTFFPLLSSPSNDDLEFFLSNGTFWFISRIFGFGLWLLPLAGSLILFGSLFFHNFFIHPHIAPLYFEDQEVLAVSDVNIFFSN